MYRDKGYYDIRHIWDSVISSIEFEMGGGAPVTSTTRPLQSQTTRWSQFQRTCCLDCQLQWQIWTVYEVVVVQIWRFQAEEHVWRSHSFLPVQQIHFTLILESSRKKGNDFKADMYSKYDRETKEQFRLLEQNLLNGIMSKIASSTGCVLFNIAHSVAQLEACTNHSSGRVNIFLLHTAYSDTQRESYKCHSECNLDG